MTWRRWPSIVRTSQRGAALFLTFLLMLVLSGLTVGVATFSYNSLQTSKSQLMDKQAFYLSEAGLQRARQQLVAGNWMAAASPGNSYTESFPSSNSVGVYVVTIVDNGGNSDTITSNGYVPNQTAVAAQRQMVESQLSVTTNDGTNNSLTATASASSTNGSNTASKANDGSTSTKWQGSNGDGWLKMDYGSATSLNKIVVKEDGNITAVTIEWSDDNSSWTTASGLSVIESPSKTWTATFTSTSHRYFRASVSAPSSKKPGIKEMESDSATISSLGTGAITTQW